MVTKKLLFVTATRADFSKLKSLIRIANKKKEFSIYVVITGMHVINKYGSTYKEVQKFFKFKSKIFKFKNQSIGDRLEIIMSKTIKKFSKIVKKIKPDLIIIHGDRVEALACASVGSLNHILTAHIEGGEVSGTIDDTMRHTITKLSHAHFVGSNAAKKRVIKMGEIKKNIFNIGSPDIDFIVNEKMSNISFIKKRYGIFFKKFAILLWHPVTSKIHTLKEETKNLLNIVKNFKMNFVVIFPNNDPGSSIIINEYKKLKKNNFKILKNLRFEYFLGLLKSSNYIIGNSSSTIYEAPMLHTPGINIGDRQHNRTKTKAVINFEIDNLNENKINKFIDNYRPIKKKYFGYGNSDKKFIKILMKKNFWEIPKQKFFSDI